MPETNSAILDAKRHARDYWDIDGLPALLVGANTVLLGVLWLPTDRHRSWWGAALVLGLCALLFLSESKKTLEWLKSRITYPRTGYVAAPQADPDSKRDPYSIISIIKEPEAKEPEALLEGRASRKAIEDFPWLLLLVLWFTNNIWLVFLACLATPLLLWREYKDDPPWFEIAGEAIAGLVILPVDDSRRFGVFLLVFGATGMVKGATLLTRYLRQHPAPQA
jgi:hypothetical protein